MNDKYSSDDLIPIRLMVQVEGKNGEWQNYIILREYLMRDLADVLINVLELKKGADDKKSKCAGGTVL